MLLFTYEIIFLLNSLKHLAERFFIMKNAKDCYKYILNNLNIKDTFLLEVENKKISENEYNKRVRLAKIEFDYGLTDK